MNKVTKVIFKKYRTAEDYLKVPEDELKQDIHSHGVLQPEGAVGARRVHPHRGGVRRQGPDTMEDLITLPGVARKTANIVLANTYGKVEGIAVDTHVKRLANRLGFSDE